MRLYRQIKLFLGIVWRVDWSERRMSIGTAWSIAKIIHKPGEVERLMGPRER